MKKIISIIGLCLICALLTGCGGENEIAEPAATEPTTTPTTAPAALPTTPAVLPTEPPTEIPTISWIPPTPTTPPPPHPAHGDLLAAYDRARAAYSRAIRGDFCCIPVFAEYLREIFAEYIVAELLAGGRYYAPAEMGGQTEYIIPITDDIVIFRVINERPDHMTQWHHEMPTSTADFIAQNIDGNWVFANFWMMEQATWCGARTQPADIYPAENPPEQWLQNLFAEAHRRMGWLASCSISYLEGHYIRMFGMDVYVHVRFDLFEDDTYAPSEDGWWARVLHDEFDTFEGFRDYLARVLPDHIIDSQLASNRYVAHGGSLFAILASGSGNIFHGARRHGFIQINEDFIIYRFTQNILQAAPDGPPTDAVSHVEISEFALINIDGNWRFATFRFVN